MNDVSGERWNGCVGGVLEDSGKNKVLVPAIGSMTAYPWTSHYTTTTTTTTTTPPNPTTSTTTTYPSTTPHPPSSSTSASVSSLSPCRFVLGLFTPPQLSFPFRSSFAVQRRVTHPKHSISCRLYSAAGPPHPPPPSSPPQRPSTTTDHLRPADEPHPMPPPLLRRVPAHIRRTNDNISACPNQPTSFSPAAHHPHPRTAHAVHGAPSPSPARPSRKRHFEAVSTIMRQLKILVTNNPIGGARAGLQI